MAGEQLSHQNDRTKDSDGARPALEYKYHVLQC